MPEPVSSTLLGGALINVGCGLLTNFLEPARKSATDRLLMWWGKGKTPENHDVLRATHDAYVAAMREMARVVGDEAFGGAGRAAARALVELCKLPEFHKFRWDGEHLPLADTIARIDALYDRRARDGDAAGWRAYNELVVYDLRAWGVELSAPIETVFVEGAFGRSPWHLVFREHFSEMLKADNKRPEGERAFRILTFETLSELRRAGAEIQGAVDRIERGQAEDRSRDEAFQSEMLDWIRAQRKGERLSDEALRGAVARFIAFRPDATPEEVLEAVEAFERDYRALLDRVSQIETVDNLVASFKAAAEAALREGDIETSRAQYAKAITAATEKAAEPARNAAALIDADAGAALVALDWQAADSAWTRAETMLAPFDADAEENLAWEAARKLKDFGNTFVAVGALDAAVRRLRELRTRAVAAGNTRNEAASENNLGNVLATQGERMGGEEGLALLVQAAAAYRTALRVYTEAATPADWAMTQNNLGNVLSAQGERTGGEAGSALLAEAVVAYRAALTVYFEATMPADWAMAQNNLGNALADQGRRTDGEAGLALLAEAVAAHRAALRVYTEAAMPVDWAMTQNNLGAALKTKGERTGGEAGLALLTEAVIAYRAALTVHTKATMPADWAMTQNNLGNALGALGRHTAGEAGLTLLAEAVAAYRSALTVRTEAAMPAKWAMTQNNLGSVLQSQGENTTGSAGLALLTDAEVAYRAALRVYTAEHFSHHHPLVMHNLARLEALIAERTA